MRLTLRTLLAYLDGNLEPDDAEDIGRKIEESEFPQKLVQLIRDCTRRPRLGAPPLSGRGLGADPNTVAEYLEYRLGDERVPEFERICLDSEIHLAEVASCHQILTLVLGEPAEIDPHSRARMYALAAQADAPPMQSDSIHQAVAAPAGPGSAVGAGNSLAPPEAPRSQGAIPPVVRRAKPEVPEYLRENRWRMWPVVAMVLVAATLTLAGLIFFGPTPFREQVTALMATPAPKTGENPESGEKTSSAETPAADAAPAGTAPAEGPAVDSAGKQAEAMPEAAATTPVGTPAGDASSAPAATSGPKTSVPESGTPKPEAAPLQPGEPAASEKPAGGDPALARPAAEAPSTDDPATAPVPPEPGVAVPGIEPGATARPAAPQPLPTNRPATPAGPDGVMPAEPQPLAGTPSNEPSATGAPAAGAPAADDGRRLPAEGFGRLHSNKLEVLLNFDAASGDWIRLPTRAPLNKGQHLLSLPLFQPTLTLSSNITIQADGLAEFELVGWDEAGVPILSVQYGRLLMSTIGKAGNAIRLQIDAQEPLLTFVDPESTLAIEVRRDLPPGKNPESGAAPLSANVYAMSGVIRVAKQDGAPVELQAPAVLSLTGTTDPQPGESHFPTWVTSEQSAADDDAASNVEAYVFSDKPVGLQLRELLDPQHKLYKRREVRTLAIRSLACLGDFEPSVAALNDADLRQYWHKIRSELQTAIARSPETAGRVREAFIKQRGETDGKALDRMLWGYSTSDLQTGSDRDLVDALARNDALDFRVLGILALEELNGGANHGYRPDDSDFKRRTSLTNWKGRVGKMVPRATGAPAKSRPTATE